MKGGEGADSLGFLGLALGLGAQQPWHVRIVIISKQLGLQLHITERVQATRPSTSATPICQNHGARAMLRRDSHFHHKVVVIIRVSCGFDFDPRHRSSATPRSSDWWLGSSRAARLAADLILRTQRVPVPQPAADAAAVGEWAGRGRDNSVRALVGRAVADPAGGEAAGVQVAAATLRIGTLILQPGPADGSLAQRYPPIMDWDSMGMSGGAGPAVAVPTPSPTPTPTPTPTESFTVKGRWAPMRIARIQQIKVAPQAL